jgi:hypothetical protein
MKTLALDDNISSHMITLAPDDNISYPPFYFSLQTFPLMKHERKLYSTYKVQYYASL